MKCRRNNRLSIMTFVGDDSSEINHPVTVTSEYQHVSQHRQFKPARVLGFLYQILMFVHKNNNKNDEMSHLLLV